jgi:phosphatidylglycerol:prolipoprotein diacylglycerol transferase
MQWWQHIPEHLDPIALTVGFFSIRWYALFFIAGFVVAVWFVLMGFRRSGDRSGFVSRDDLIETLFTLFIGALVGGRLGYVFFYDPAFFLESPLRIISPYDPVSGWVGLSGMSFHGGVIGVAAAFVIAAVQGRVASFWRAADFLACVAPIALFFGRLGNFFNIELYGRVTERPWGVVFPGVWPFGALRHPSALYEAALEGAVLFVLLLMYRRTNPFPGAVFSVFLITYASFRFAVEYFREPDLMIGLLAGGLSLGQWLSLLMAGIGVALFGLVPSHFVKNRLYQKK